MLVGARGYVNIRERRIILAALDLYIKLEWRRKNHAKSKRVFDDAEFNIARAADLAYKIKSWVRR